MPRPKKIAAKEKLAAKAVIEADAVITDEEINYNPKPVKKTGTPLTYVPANVGLGDIEAPEGYKVRWVRNDNIVRRQAEGYEILTTTNCPNAVNKSSNISGVDGSQIGGAITYRELTAMIVPDEIAKDRKRYYEELTKERTKLAITASGARKELNNASRGTSPDLQPTITID